MIWINCSFSLLLHLKDPPQLLWCTSLWEKWESCGVHIWIFSPCKRSAFPLSCPRSRLKIHHLTNSNNFTTLRSLLRDVAVFMRLIFVKDSTFEWILAFLLRNEIWRDTQVEGQNKVVKYLFFRFRTEINGIGENEIDKRFLFKRWILEISFVSSKLHRGSKNFFYCLRAESIAIWENKWNTAASNKIYS